jgi:DMSO/TMAO reductase YedYZ molybdopterin-dependent catalytic subunit
MMSDKQHYEALSELHELLKKGNSLNRREFIKYLGKTTAASALALAAPLTLLSPALVLGRQFPDFYTKNEDYYVTRIGKVPKIDANEYRLEVTGLVEKPRSFTIGELRALPSVKLPVTMECIGNSPDGPLVSTALWEGFSLYDLLSSLGLNEKSTGVVYRAADGYFASHTLEQIKNNNVLGALYMNGEVLPVEHGFPIRILNPGFYGVKQPQWVTQMEVIDSPIKDYWELQGWDCSPPMAADNVIFSPKKTNTVRTKRRIEIIGAAFGGTRIAKVEVTTDQGQTWKEAEIVQRIDTDYVWVFWKTTLRFDRAGRYQMNSRATDIHGNVQREEDPIRFDGNNDWPVLKFQVRN